MKKLRDESGQTLVLVALSMTVLLGFAAFATDVGVMLHEKRLAQSAADSAAISAAFALSKGTDVGTAGKAAAAANGFTDGATDSNGYTTRVTIYSSPVDGQFVGQSGYTEAVITKQVPTFFMRLFGTNFDTIGVRAVATDKGVSNYCLQTTKTTGPTMVFQGSFHVDAPGCDVYNASNDPDALQFTGGAGRLSASSVSVVGGDGGQTTDSTPAPTTGALYTSDPLAGTLTTPTYDPTNLTTCPVTTSIGTSSSQTYIANPGVVCFQNPLGNINLTNVNLAPGIYVFDNPLGTLVLSGAINGPAKAGSTDSSPGNAIDTTGGVGVTIYLLGGMNETAGTVINLTAPGSGDYKDILLWGATSDQPLTSTLCPTGNGNAGPGIIQLNLGNSSGNFSGIIYAPSSDLVFQDSGSDSNGPDLTTDIIVGTMCDQTADINITSFSQTVDGGRFPKISLVE